MKSSKNLFPTLMKATCLSSIIFWTMVVIPKDMKSDIIPLIILSIIPIFVISSITILITITPFFIAEKRSTNNKIIFNKYFPYYSIVVFIIFSYGVIDSDFEVFVVAFFTSAFFTLMQSWVWLFSDNFSNFKEK